MRLKTLLGRKTVAVAFVVGVVGLGLTGCFPDTSATPPSDPLQNELYQSLNQDRASVGLPPLTWSPKLANNAGTWANQMASANSLYHQNLSVLLGSGDYASYNTLGENILVGPGTMSARPSRVPGRHRRRTGPTSPAARSTSSASATSGARTAGSGRSRSSAGSDHPTLDTLPQRMRPQPPGCGLVASLPLCNGHDGRCGHTNTSRGLSCGRRGAERTKRSTSPAASNIALDDRGHDDGDVLPGGVGTDARRRSDCVRHPLARVPAVAAALPPGHHAATPPRTSRRRPGPPSLRRSSASTATRPRSGRGCSPWRAARAIDHFRREARRPSIPVDPVALGAAAIVAQGDDPGDTAVSTLETEAALALHRRAPARSARRGARCARSPDSTSPTSPASWASDRARCGSSPTGACAPWPAGSRRPTAP